MNNFGSTSLQRLRTCHPDLILIAYELSKEIDIAVLDGARTKEKQNEAFKNGKSKLQYPKSKHNIGKEAGREFSDAIDLAPFPIDWNNIARFEDMCKRIEAIAKRLNIKIRLGRDFSFKDYPHIERIPWEKGLRRLYKVY